MQNVYSTSAWKFLVEKLAEAFFLESWLKKTVDREVQLKIMQPLPRPTGTLWWVASDKSSRVEFLMVTASPNATISPFSIQLKSWTEQVTSCSLNLGPPPPFFWLRVLLVKGTGQSGSGSKVVFKEDPKLTVNGQ